MQPTDKVEQFIQTKGNLFPTESLPLLRQSLLDTDDDKFMMAQSMGLKSPTAMLLISIFLGNLGVDRFMFGEVGMGILKLLTGGCFYILWLIDIINSGKKTRRKNFENLMVIINPTAAKEIPGQKPSFEIPEFTPEDMEENKGMAALTYILFFVPLITGDHKKSAFVKFHTNQSLLLILSAVALQIIKVIFTFILMSFASVLYPLYSFFVALTVIIKILSWAAPVAFAVLGIVNVLNKKIKPLPLIGDKFKILK